MMVHGILCEEERRADIHREEFVNRSIVVSKIVPRSVSPAAFTRTSTRQLVIRRASPSAHPPSWRGRPARRSRACLAGSVRPGCAPRDAFRPVRQSPAAPAAAKRARWLRRALRRASHHSDLAGKAAPPVVMSSSPLPPVCRLRFFSAEHCLSPVPILVSRKIAKSRFAGGGRYRDRIGSDRRGAHRAHPRGECCGACRREAGFGE